MSKRSATRPDTYYTRLPLRKIVGRWTEVRPECPQYPYPMITLECGHTDYYRGQKGKVRCGSCGPADVA